MEVIPGIIDNDYLKKTMLDARSKYEALVKALENRMM